MDKDNKLTSFPTDKNLLYNLRYEGSISVWHNHPEYHKCLLDNGFTLTFEEDIMHAINCCEYGDIPEARNMILISSISKEIFIDREINDLSSISEEFINYRCMKPLLFDVCSYYEYIKWLASFEELQHKYKIAKLTCRIRSDIDMKTIEETISKILPESVYYSIYPKVYNLPKYIVFEKFWTSL